MRQPFRYQHVTDGPTVLINYKGNGEDRAAFDDERSVIVVSGIEGTRQQVEDFLAGEDILNWAEWADRALREDCRLPERGAEWDGNALTAPPPLTVEFAPNLQVTLC